MEKNTNLLPPREIAKFPFHENPLYSTTDSSKECIGCGEKRVDPAGGYESVGRNVYNQVYVHKSCIEVINPSHPTQPLSLIPLISVKHCSVCNRYLTGGYGYSYPFGEEASICGECARNELYIDPKKSHEHRLFILLKRFFSFPCDACGLANDESFLCVCIPCRFTIHMDCVNLPRVICVNRHNHRIYQVPRLGPGEWVCGVCREKIDGRYGAYSCSTCSFVSHSKCATRPDVWDGEDLEGVPEDDPEDIIPFKLVEEGVIKHFTHEHNLMFTTEDDIGYDKNKQCYACVLPIFSGPCYVCILSDFILHEACANLPKKIRHISHSNQFILYQPQDIFHCYVCEQFCSGFAYKASYFEIDVRCVSIYDGYVHKSQPNSMLLAPFNINADYHDCSSCGKSSEYWLIVSGHDNLFMCYKCATTPLQVMYKYDEHLLSLRFGENATGDYWCEICEEKMDSQKWFYTCDECCTTVHIDCVIGRQPYLRIGSTFRLRSRVVEVDVEWLKDNSRVVEVVRNNFASRPNCYGCWSRIVSTPFFHGRSIESFFCSLNCLGLYWPVSFL